MSIRLYHTVTKQVIRKLGVALGAILVVVALNGSLFGQACQGCSEPTIQMRMNGFGPHTNASWRPYQGLIDNSCTSSTNCNNQAVFLKNMTDATCAAAAVAAIEGFDSQPATAIQGLEFDFRTDGGCFPGPLGVQASCSGTPVNVASPKWEVRMKNTASGASYLYVIDGCTSMTTGAPFTNPADGKTWVHKSVSPATLGTFYAANPPGTIITSLAILYNAGDVVTPGFAFLDNIKVTGMPNTQPTTTITKLWTEPKDNGTAP